MLHIVEYRLTSASISSLCVSLLICRLDDLLNLFILFFIDFLMNEVVSC